MADLKLIALDQEDLAVLSAHVQDAVVRVGDVTYLPGEKRFAMVINRFDWSKPSKAGGYIRARSGLRFEKVLSAQVAGIDLGDKAKVLSLLAVTFQLEDEPSGWVELVFSGKAAIRLRVECIESELRDLGAQWATKTKPTHPEEDG